MLKRFLNALGYVSKIDAEQYAKDRVNEAIAMIESTQPGDELAISARIMRKYGFKVVYALGDSSAEENCKRLCDSLVPSVGEMDSVRVEQILRSVKVVDDASLLS